MCGSSETIEYCFVDAIWFNFGNGKVKSLLMIVIYFY